MNEMAIRTHIEFDGHGYGYIDMGTELDNDSLPAAKEVLVFMVVSLKFSWKLPIAYFFIDGLGGEERKSLILNCLERLNDVGVKIVSLTVDGSFSDLTMLNCLKMNVHDPYNMKSYFAHPITGDSVYVFPDPCHMLKLIRNTLAEKGSIFVNSDPVKWQFIERLRDFQQSEGLHLGNNPRSSHVNWYKRKMNVELALQTLSLSVANALQFLLEEGEEEFKDCGETIKFIQNFNTLFDILNSRNLRSSGFKRPIQEGNFTEYFSFLEGMKSYILSMTESVNGRKLIDGTRKTGFVGFLLCINSLIGLYNDLVTSKHFNLNFILTHNFSQDHIKLFFEKVRSMGECNNNDPTCRQFKSAFKRLICDNDLQDNLGGNGVPVVDVATLTASSCKQETLVCAVQQINSSSDRGRMLVEENPFDSNENPDSVALFNNLQVSKYRYCTKIVVYIAGFVVHQLKKMIHCEVCCSALTTDVVSDLHSLILSKSGISLTIPSADVIDICLESEKLFRSNIVNGKYSTVGDVEGSKLASLLLHKYIHKPIFSSISGHMMEMDGLNNHVILLIKAVCQKYIKVRYHYAGGQYTAFLKDQLKCKSRQNSNKLVLFSGQ